MPAANSSAAGPVAIGRSAAAAGLLVAAFGSVAVPCGVWLHRRRRRRPDARGCEEQGLLLPQQPPLARGAGNRRRLEALLSRQLASGGGIDVLPLDALPALFTHQVAAAGIDAADRDAEPAALVGPAGKAASDSANSSSLGSSWGWPSPSLETAGSSDGLQPVLPPGLQTAAVLSRASTGDTPLEHAPSAEATQSGAAELASRQWGLETRGLRLQPEALEVRGLGGLSGCRMACASACLAQTTATGIAGGASHECGPPSPDPTTHPPPPIHHHHHHPTTHPHAHAHMRPPSAAAGWSWGQSCGARCRVPRCGLPRQARRPPGGGQGEGAVLRRRRPYPSPALQPPPPHAHTRVRTPTLPHTIWAASLRWSHSQCAARYDQPQDHPSPTLISCVLARQVFELHPGMHSHAVWQEASLMRHCSHPRVLSLLGIALKVSQPCLRAQHAV